MLSDADRQVLEFASALQLVRRDHVTQLLEVSPDEAERQLSALTAAGRLSRQRVGLHVPACFRVTSAGADAIASVLTPPGLQQRVRHAVGVGSLRLMANRGFFGPADRVLTEREMEAADQHGDVDSPFATRPADFGGRVGSHYADLMLLTKQGRIAVELLLGVREPPALEAVLRAYAADVRMSAVLYVVGDPWVGRLVQAAAARLELSPMVQVQLAALS